MDTTFATWLKEEARARNWSLRELARRASVSHGIVSAVAAGQRQPTWDFCVALARAFHLAPEDVFRRAGLLAPPLSAGRVREELLEFIDVLTEEDQRIILQVAQRLAQNITAVSPTD
jgi:transcriptional regulator with XRE-family HTH domain